VVYPLRNSKLEREHGGPRWIHGQTDSSAKRVLGLFDDLDFLVPVNRRLDFVGSIGDCGEPIVGRAHPQTRYQLGPSLMHVGGAAAEFRSQAIEVRVYAIR